MANHKSAVKQHRVDIRRRAENRLHKTRVRTAVRGFRKAVAEGDGRKAQSLLVRACSLLDRAAKTGALHDNTVARTKSRLQRASNRLSA